MRSTCKFHRLVHGKDSDVLSSPIRNGLANAPSSLKQCKACTQVAYTSGRDTTSDTNWRDLHLVSVNPHVCGGDRDAVKCRRQFEPHKRVS